MTDRRSGFVKWYDDEKGYGFVKPVEGGGDVFLHRSALSQAAIFSIGKGDEITFTVTQSTRGARPVAADIEKAGGGW